MKIITSALLGLCLAGSLQSFAGTTTTYTNVTTRALTLTLTAQAQASESSLLTATIGSREVLADLGLPPQARLFAIDGVGMVARLNTSSNTIDYAISTSALNSSYLNTVLFSAQTVYFIGTYTASLSSTNGSIVANLQGYSSESMANGSQFSTVAGAGYVNDQPALFQGTVQFGPQVTKKFKTGKYLFVPAQVIRPTVAR